MKICIPITFLVLILASCLSSRHRVELSNLTIEGKKRNSLIEDRVPDYGDGHKDGCVLMSQISIEVVMLNKDKVTGSVMDSKSKEPLQFATVHLFSSDRNDTLSVISDSTGYFEAELKSELTKIQTKYIGYRTLTIDLTKLK